MKDPWLGEQNKGFDWDQYSRRADGPLLSFRLATLIYREDEHNILRPYGSVDGLWLPDRIQRMSCKYGHTQPNIECGCGILTTFDYEEVKRVWNNCKIVDDFDQYHIWTVVQNMGDLVYDIDRGLMLSRDIFLWGILLPRGYGNLPWLRHPYHDIGNTTSGHVDPYKYRDPVQAWDDVDPTIKNWLH